MLSLSHETARYLTGFFMLRDKVFHEFLQMKQTKKCVLPIAYSINTTKRNETTNAILG